MIKWIFRLIVLIGILSVLIIVLTDKIVKEIIVSQLNRHVGLESSIGSVDVHFLSPKVRIENLVLYNSAHFGGAKFIESPEITIEYDFARALRGEAQIKLLRINLSAINIVSDKINRVNFEELFKTGYLKNGPNGKSSFPPVFIEVMNLSIGVVRFIDIENPLKVQEVPLNINNYIVRNVNSKELNGVFFHNLILKILLDSGKVEIRDGKIVLRSN